MRVALYALARETDLPPPRRPQLDSQIGHRHPLGLGQLEPPVLLLGIEWGNLCMVTPSEIVPTSVRVDPSRHIDHVAQALHVIAGDPRSLLILFTPTGIAVADPLPSRRLTAASHPTQTLTGFHPGSDVDVPAGGPSCIGAKRYSTAWFWYLPVYLPLRSHPLPWAESLSVFKDLVVHQCVTAEIPSWSTVEPLVRRRFLPSVRSPCGRSLAPAVARARALLRSRPGMWTDGSPAAA